jgi:hypothetical protein
MPVPSGARRDESPSGGEQDGVVEARAAVAHLEAQAVAVPFRIDLDAAAVGVGGVVEEVEQRLLERGFADDARRRRAVETDFRLGVRPQPAPALDDLLQPAVEIERRRRPRRGPGRRAPPGR